jgi:hypothetical protein
MNYFLLLLSSPTFILLHPPLSLSKLHSCSTPVFVIISVWFLYECVACTCRFGKVLSGLQLTFEQQCDGTTSLTSVKTTRKLVSVALEVKIKNKKYTYIKKRKNKKLEQK